MPPQTVSVDPSSGSWSIAGILPSAGWPAPSSSTSSNASITQRALTGPWITSSQLTSNSKTIYHMTRSSLRQFDASPYKTRQIEAVIYGLLAVTVQTPKMAAACTIFNIQENGTFCPSTIISGSILPPPRFAGAKSGGDGVRVDSLTAFAP